MNCMKIDNRNIGPDFPPYIIAEIGANHNGSVADGKRLINAAIDAGASAIKLQCYTADKLTFRGEGEEFKIMEGPWKGQTLHELYKKAESPRNLVKELLLYGQTRDKTIFSSVFTLEDVEFLAELGVPAFKIASFELTDLPLIQEVAKTDLPTIISTGMGSTEEIIDSINAFNYFSVKPENLTLLHCVSSYPALPREANLPALGPLSTLGEGCHVVGLSDHSLGVGIASAAVAFGASIIEKHFTLDRSSGGPDSGFSLEPHEFSLLVMTCNEAWQAIQTDSHPKASPNLAFRKSLYAVCDISAGERFCKENVRAIRPAAGLAPRFYQTVLAGVATQDIKAGTPLLSSMVSALS